MKSKLRSRWYRSNEKPLESNKNSQKVNEPFGEISNTDTNLKDDLSKFSGSTSNISKGINNNESKRKDKSFKKNSRPRRKKTFGDSQKPNPQADKNKPDSGKIEKSSHKDYKPKRKRRHKKPESKVRKNIPNASSKVTKKTGLSGILSKIFGK